MNRNGMEIRPRPNEPLVRNSGTGRRPRERDQEREEHTTRAPVRRRARVRDHEEGEQEQGPVLEPVQRDRHRLAQPQRAPANERGVEDEERDRHVAARGAIDHEAADTGHQESEEGRASPLAGRHPYAAGEQEHGQGEVRRIEHVFAADADHELAADGQHRRAHRQRGRVGAQEEAQRQAGDERATRIEGAQAPHARAGVLRHEDGDENDGGPCRLHFEIQPQEA